MAAPRSVIKGDGTNRVRRLNGELVKNTWYNGVGCGHGKYWAGSINGELVLDESGKPMKFKSIGQLELEF